MLIQYKALNPKGILVADTLVLDRMDQACAELTRRGLIPVSIEPKADSAAVNPTGNSLTGRLVSAAWKNKHASRRELPGFTSQMAILLESGTPVTDSLEAIERQMTCPHWQSLVRRLRQDVEEGKTLAEAVREFPQVFDPIYGSMIAAGETCGNLPSILRRLSDISRQSSRIRHKVVSAMIYPALLTTVATAVMGVLVFFVLPRFAEIFEEMKVQLPASTKAMISLSDFVRHHVILSLALAASAVVALVLLLRSEKGRRFRQRILLRVPVFGVLIRSVINARLFRLLGLLIQSNVPLLQSLDLARQASGNYLYTDLMEETHRRVLNGQTMYDTLSQSALIPPAIAQMVHTAEKNGQLGNVLLLLADDLDDHNETKIGMLTSIMEPLILIFMGIVIGTLAISLVLPMFDLSQISGH